jgi:phage-related protein
MVCWLDEGGVRAEFLRSLSDQEAGRVTKLLDLLEHRGTQLTLPYARRVEGTQLWELRVRGKVQHRIFYVAVHGHRFILLHAFTKKTQRTPKREIKTAE